MDLPRTRAALAHYDATAIGGPALPSRVEDGAGPASPPTRNGDRS